MSLQRPQGTLRYWNQNNYGFIQLDGFPPRANEVFVHLAAFEQARLEPRVGTCISFDVGAGLPSKQPTNNRLRITAVNLTPVA